jgi:uncharacterized membrane protein
MTFLQKKTVTHIFLKIRKKNIKMKKIHESVRIMLLLLGSFWVGICISFGFFVWQIGPSSFLR